MHDFLFILLIAGFSFAATYHVEPDGLDEGSGPFRSIQYAISRMQAGDELIIADGLYRERGIRIDRAGSSAAPITIKGAPGSRPIIDLGLAITGWTLQENGLYRGTTSFSGDDAPQYVEGLVIDTTPMVKVASEAEIGTGTFFVEGTTVYARPPEGEDPRQHHSTLLAGSSPDQQNSAGAPDNRPAISITSAGHFVFENLIVQGGYFNFWPNTWGATRGRNITIRNVTARYSILMAIRTDGYDDIVVDNCDIYQAGLWNIRRLGDRGWPHAVIGYNSDRFVIKNSRIHDNHGEGIGPFLSCRDWHMHDNVVWDNWGINIYLDTQMGYSSAVRNIVFGTDRYELTAKSGSLVHIAIHNENADLNWGWPDNTGHSVDSIVIANNIVFGNGIAFRCFPYNGGPSTYRDILVANNTFSCVPLETEDQVRMEKGDNFRFVNNIVTTGKMWIADGVGEGITVSHNILPTANPNNNQTNVTISGNLAVDPLFTRSGSPRDPG